MKFNQFKQKINHLPVFSTSMLGSLTNDPATLKVQLSSWGKKGLVSLLRRGLYVLGAQERKINPSHFYLANQIYIPSYVSMESALAYYELIPEFVALTTSITVRKTARFENEFGIFMYQHIHAGAYGGFETLKAVDDLPVFVATPEKAVVDFIYLNLSKFGFSDTRVFTESYRFQNCGNLNRSELQKYAKRFKSKKLLTIIDLFIETCIQPAKRSRP